MANWNCTKLLSRSDGFPASWSVRKSLGHNLMRMLSGVFIGGQEANSCMQQPEVLVMVLPMLRSMILQGCLSLQVNQHFCHRMVKRRWSNSTINHANSRASEPPGCDLEGETMSQPAGAHWSTTLSLSPVSKEVAADTEDTATCGEVSKIYQKGPAQGVGRPSVWSSVRDPFL